MDLHPLRPHAGESLIVGGSSPNVSRAPLNPTARGKHAVNAVMQSARPRVPWGGSEKGRDEQGAPRLLRAGGWSTGQARAGAGRAPQGRALAVGTQSRAVSPHVRIAGLPSFSVEHARPSLPYDALRCSLQSAWLRVQHTAGDGGPGPLTGWTVLKQRLSHGRGAASRASPKLGPVPHPVL